MYIHAQVEQRRALHYPELREASSYAQLACRYRFLDLWPCGKLDLEVPDFVFSVCNHTWVLSVTLGSTAMRVF